VQRVFVGGVLEFEEVGGDDRGGWSCVCALSRIIAAAIGNSGVST